MLWGLIVPFLLELSLPAEGSSGSRRELQNAESNSRRSWADFARLRQSAGEKDRISDISQEQDVNQGFRSHIHQENVFQIDNEVSFAKKATRPVKNVM